MIWSVSDRASLTKGIGKEKYLDGVKHMEEIISGEEFSDLHVLDMFCRTFVVIFI